MATGDITSVVITDKTTAGTDSDGWFADITIEGFVDGGTYDYGYTGNNDPSGANVVFTVTSEGYNTSGTLGTVTRTVYGTKTIRQAYPNNATLDETESGGNLTVRVALSEPIYDDDKNGGAGTSGTDPTVSIAAGWYTDDGAGGTSSGNNAASGLTVTNNSTLDYPKVVANWSRPPFDLVTGDFDLAVVGFHGHGTNGAPLACVVFDVGDQSTNTTSTTVSSCAIDTSYGDAAPVQEYIGTIDVSGLDANEKLDCNFTAYPRVGDANSIIDSSTGTAQPTPFYGPVHVVNDKSGTFGTTVALVDDVSGNDGTGVAYDSGSYNEGTAAAFATINAAAVAIRAYNNTNRSRNDCSGGIIYLTDGGHTWTGAGAAISHAHDGWLTITRGLNSTSRAAVTIDAQGSATALSAKVKIVDVNITSAATITFQDQEHLWLDQCTVAGTGTALIYGHTHTYVTRSTLSAANAGLLRPFSTSNTPNLICRGNTITSAPSSNQCYAYVFIGNLGSATIGVIDNYSGQTIEQVLSPIMAFNNLHTNNIDVAVQWKMTTANQGEDGAALVGNLIERIKKDTQPMIQVASDSTTNTPVNNIILWNNVLMGQRQNMAYNDTGSGAAQRTKWFLYGNIFNDWNIKTDVFAPEDAGRVGSWPVLHQCGGSCNLLADASNGFDCDWAGLESSQPNWTSPNPNTLFAFEDYQAYNGTGADGTAGTGGGDYRTEYSGAQATASRGPLPYDLTGRARPTSGTEYFGSHLPVPDPPTSVAQV